MTRLIAADRSARPAPLTIAPGNGWQEYAACAGLDPNAWFAEGAYGDFEDARETCVTVCPVKEQCLAMAMREGHTHGMYGGLDPKQRRAMRRKLLPSSQAAAARRSTEDARVLNAQRVAMYQSGASDAEMAAAGGVKVKTIRDWRRYRGLQNNVGPVKLSQADQAANRQGMYDKGCDDQEIADAEGVARFAIAKWRFRRGLPAHTTKRVPS